KMKNMESNHITTTGEKIFGINTEIHRFGLNSAILLIVGVAGGLAVGLGAIEYVISLSLVVIPSMTTHSLLLAVAPWLCIIASGGVCLIVDVMFITYFLLT